MTIRTSSHLEFFNLQLFNTKIYFTIRNFHLKCLVLCKIDNPKTTD